MRTIRFRGRTPQGRWYYGSLTTIEGKPPMITTDKGEVVEVVPISVGQWTGLQDFAGHDIYERDILALGANRRTPNGLKYYIPLDSPSRALLVEYRDGAFETELASLAEVLMCHEAEVVGNVAEDLPEEEAA